MAMTTTIAPSPAHLTSSNHLDRDVLLRVVHHADPETARLIKRASRIMNGAVTQRLLHYNEARWRLGCGKSPGEVVFWAAREGHGHVIEKIGKEFPQWVEVDKSSAVDALWVASEKGFVDIVRMLLESGVDPNATNTRLEAVALWRVPAAPIVFELERSRPRDNNDDFTHECVTPLIVASYRGHLDVIALLLEKGATRGLRVNPFGGRWEVKLRTALDAAICNDQIEAVKMLISPMPDSDPIDIEVLAELLVIAIQYNSTQTAHFLSQLGADPILPLQPLHNRSLLTWAVDFGTKKAIQLMEDIGCNVLAEMVVGATHPERIKLFEAVLGGGVDVRRDDSLVLRRAISGQSIRHTALILRAGIALNDLSWLEEAARMLKGPAGDGKYHVYREEYGLDVRKAVEAGLYSEAAGLLRDGGKDIAWLEEVIIDFLGGPLISRQ